ncbi:MAG: oligosaccharide flippase family protein [Candidatus Woesebacteria bacterium]|jgi:O-antigen/teichoic acid export membrane protein
MTEHTAADTTDEVAEILSETEIKEIKKRSVAGSISYFLRSAFLNGIGFLSNVIISGLFTPDDFGLYGLVTNIIAFLVFFSDIGLASSLLQKRDKPSLKDYRTAFTIQQILSWVIVLISVFVFATGFAQSKFGPAAGWVLLSLAISFPLSSLKVVPSIMLERKLDFSKLVVPQIFEQIVYHSILIILALNKFGAISYAYAILARSIIGVIVMYYIKPWKIGFELCEKSLKKLLNFGAKFQLNDILARLKDQLFFIFLAKFLPSTEFGYVQWAKSWSMYPYNLTVQNVMAVTFPTFSRLQERKDLLKKAIEKSIFFITLLIFPILTGMSLFIFPLVKILEQYSKWQPAALSFVLFTMSIAWAALSTPLVNTLNAIGHINKSLKLMIMWTILTWVLTPIMMKFFGFNGVAIASMIISFTAVFSIRLLRKVIRIDFWPNISSQVLATMAMAIVGILGMSIWSMDLIRMISGMALCTLVYLIVVFLFGRRKIWVEIKSLKR